jgi:hypothetical protein
MNGDPLTPTRAAVGSAVGTAVFLLAACGGGGESIDARLRLVVPDNNIRVEGVECAGARPFAHVHAGAPYTVEASDGTVVAEGRLPAGRAVNADPTIDWGVARIPTVCVIELDLDLPERARYELRLEEGPPLQFDAQYLSSNEQLDLIVQ